MIKHLEYDDDLVQNDIAILKLAHEVELNSHVQLACLPDKTQHPFPKRVGTPIYASGWGKLYFLSIWILVVQLLLLI